MSKEHGCLRRFADGFLFVELVEVPYEQVRDNGRNGELFNHVFGEGMYQLVDVERSPAGNGVLVLKSVEMR